MPEWAYGDAWEQFPIEPGEIWGIDSPLSEVAVHDIYEPLPAFMRRADLLFVDPPWNGGNLNAFHTKAGRDLYRQFDDFLAVLLARIQEIAPAVCYIEMGFQNADRVKDLLPYPAVQSWPVTYYRKYPCHLIRGGLAAIDFDYTGIDEERCIEILAEREHYECAGDLCMGRGLLGLAAHKAGRSFVGTELARRRLAHLLARLSKRGAAVRRLSP